MKLLLFGFCLLLAGCASQSHSHVKIEHISCADDYLIVTF